MSSLLPHFERLRERFTELEASLAEGSLFSDPERAQAATREHSNLKRSLASFAAYEQALKQSEENLKLAASESSADLEMAELLAEERADLDLRLPQLELAARAALLPPDPDAGRNVILEIRAGTGGLEASLFAGELLRMYTRYAERTTGWKLEVMEISPGDLGGVRDVTCMVTGDDAFMRLRLESGVHRVQRVPVTEGGGRIHTSTATVAVLPEAREVDVVLKPDDLRVEVCRSGGPGGQGVNTTDSAVQILHIPTGTIVRCQDGRSQIKNREKAMSVLRSRLLERARQEEADRYSAQRRDQVGTGDRNEKIRTYNFPQNRVTDHRIGLTLHSLPDIMDGAIEPILKALAEEDLARRLTALFPKEEQ